MQAPVMVLSKLTPYLLIINPNSVDANTKRETGKSAQLGNVQAAKVCFHFSDIYLNIHYSGSCGYYSNNAGSKINAENAVRSHGGNCDNK